MNNLTEEQIKKIKNMGALQYDAEKMATLMDLDEKEVQAELKNKNSTFYKAYNNGFEQSNYLIHLKLLEMAQSGDTKAISKLEQLRKAEVLKKIDRRHYT